MLPSQFRVISLVGSREEVKKINFKDGGHFGFPIGMILALFDLRHPNAFLQVSSHGLSVQEKK